MKCYLYCPNIKPKVIANILFISSWYPNKEDPTLGIFVQRHAEAAGIYNHVAVLHVLSDQSISKANIQYSENKTYKELIVNYPKVNSQLPRWANLTKVKQYKFHYNLGLTLLAEKGFIPDIVHCNIMNPVGLIAKYWKRKHQLPYVVTEHWTGYLESDGRYKKSTLLKLLIPSIARRSEMILPVSDDLKRALQKNRIGKNFNVVRNVVDTDQFFIQEKTKTGFLVVADLENSQKNISGIIYSFQEVLYNNPNLQLHIAGGGTDEDQLKSLVEELNLSESIHFHGRISAEGINDLLAQSYASVLFSNYENLPCVIVESFAAGVPFIATDVGGIREILHAERGILIPARNQSALVDAMLQTIQTSWDKNTIRAYAVKHFSKASIGKEFDHIYKSILGE